MQINLSPGKKAYFASDFHLGVPSLEKSLIREKKIVRWLDKVSIDAQVIFLVGDLFDFWFEYNTVVPKGFTRFLGKLAELSDKGIELVIFTGNHDLWMFGYLEKELNAKIIKDPIDIKIDSTSILIGHGDGLGPHDKGYKSLKKIFTNRFFQWCFHRLHPNFGINLAGFWSRKSRAQGHEKEQTFLGEDEWLWQYTKLKEQQQHRDLYIFGHRHLPLDLVVTENSRYVNLGEWINHFTYGELEQGQFKLKKFEN
jgi:UDP-2,3-diacylglucosamine hydrolase